MIIPLEIFVDVFFFTALQRYPYYYTSSRWFCYGFLEIQNSFLVGAHYLLGRKYLCMCIAYKSSFGSMIIALRVNGTFTSIRVHGCTASSLSLSIFFHQLLKSTLCLTVSVAVRQLIDFDTGHSFFMYKQRTWSLH